MAPKPTDIPRRLVEKAAIEYPTNPYVAAPAVKIEYHDKIDRYQISPDPKCTQLTIAFVSFSFAPDSYNPIAIGLRTHRFERGKGTARRPIPRPAAFDAQMERELRCLRPEAENEHASRFLMAIEQAVNEFAPDIICCNELAFPTLHGVPNRQVMKTLCDLSDEANVLIIAGSAHDVRSTYNTAFVFYPHCPPEGLWYHKQVSAHAVTERISVPSPRVAHLLAWRGFAIGLLTCFDIMDIAAVAAFTNYRVRPALLFVPAFSAKKEKLAECAKETSRAINGVVIIVNAYHANQTDDSGVVAHDAGQLRGVNPIVRPSVVPGVRTCSLVLDADEFAEMRLVGEAAADRHWLFGYQNFYKADRVE